MIQASSDVALQNPLWAVEFANDNVALADGIGTIAFPSESVGIGIGVSLGDWLHSQ